MPQPKAKEEDWLIRPQPSSRRLGSFIVVLAATVLADLFIDHHGKFGIDGTIGFYAWYGFLGCAGLAALASLLGVFLRRPADYYDH